MTEQCIAQPVPVVALLSTDTHVPEGCECKRYPTVMLLANSQHLRTSKTTSMLKLTLICVAFLQICIGCDYAVQQQRPNQAQQTAVAKDLPQTGEEMHNDQSGTSVGLAKSPLEIVNARMSAHNQHDMKAFLSCYSENIQVYDFPTTKLGSRGKKHIEKIFSPLFAAQAVKATVHSQMVNGNFVVNRETVVREGNSAEYISIYEVKDGAIESVRFIK